LAYGLSKKSNFLCSKNSLTKLVGYHPTCFCVMIKVVVGTISLSRELLTLSCSCFHSCEFGTIVYGKWCVALQYVLLWKLHG